MTITKTVIGVDVGSGSVRAGIFLISTDLCYPMPQKKITTTRRSGSRVEQSSREIWQAVCSCIRNALTLADVCAQSVAGIGFDATCSLVVLDKKTVIHCLSARKEMQSKNIIVWMDHRATEQAERINATHHPVLNYVGGKNFA
ncbi:FGGY family carbohydrate kinase [Escherichia coli]